MTTLLDLIEESERRMTSSCKELGDSHEDLGQKGVLLDSSQSFYEPLELAARNPAGTRESFLGQLKTVLTILEGRLVEERKRRDESELPWFAQTHDGKLRAYQSLIKEMKDIRSRVEW